MKKSLAALAERWEARAAARQAATNRPGEAEPVANEAPATLPPAPPPGTPAAWGLTATERAAALARESLDLPALSQLSQVSRPGSLISESGAPDAPPAEPWLAHLARRVAAALAAGAEREADPAGWLLLIRPDGDRLAIKPHIVVELDRAGLLPVLPKAEKHSTYAARARPAEWWDGTDTPQAGDRCRCGSMRFWTERDGRGDWRCSTCHPPLHLGTAELVAVTTERTET